MIKPAIHGQDGKTINNTNANQTLLFLRHGGAIMSMLFKNDRLIRIISKAENSLPEGSIVIAKVDNISKGFDSIFLMAKDKQKLFIRSSDLLPECNLSRKGEGPKCGDNYLVQIKRLPSKNKLASATCKIKGEDTETLIKKASNLTDYYVLKEGSSNIFDLIDLLDENDRIICQSQDLYDEVIGKAQEKGLHNISVYEDDMVPLNVVFSVEKHLNQALSTKINLKSGASLYIENTESMCVIDVNSAKSTDNKSVLDINLEAAKEVILQLSLRNISGIIIVDFINMPSKEDIKILMDSLREYAKEDSFVHIHDYTVLGLVEITRKKSGLTLSEQFIES